MKKNVTHIGNLEFEQQMVTNTKTGAAFRHLNGRGRSQPTGLIFYL
jgi:hypothetical protein